MELGYPDPLLLVEDTPSLSMMYQAVLKRAGLNVRTAATSAEAHAVYQAQPSRIILLDLVLPDGDGIDFLREIRRVDPSAKVLVITANGSINRAVDAMRNGAFDFLVKPFDDRRLLAAVQNAIASLELEANEDLADTPPIEEIAGFHGFVGSSPQMRQIYEMMRNIGRSTATVFITGESGTGKEIAAQTIHRLSTRRSGPFVPINCGAIPRDLLESEVFGHLKGSFTGAISDKIGAAAAADGGTLFLDEICEMDQALQTKLLRFLQTSMIQPVGAIEARKIDVRIVCATNRDPAAEVRAGRFREDLYYRLHVVPIAMPPLRERADDVIEIAENLLARFAREEGKRFRHLGEPTRHIFRTYPWPGNVRQLQNVLRNVVVLYDGEAITPEMLPREIVLGVEDTGQIPAPEGVTIDFPDRPVARQIQTSDAKSSYSIRSALEALVGTSLADLEREFIEATIRKCDGSIPRAARLLDLSPSTLYRKRDAWSRDDEPLGTQAAMRD